MPPKSYAEIVRGARRAPPPRAPPLPVLPPSTSSSRVVEVVDEPPSPSPSPAPAPAPSQLGSRPRSYASALRGTSSPPPPPPPPSPPQPEAAAAAATPPPPPPSPPEMETVVSKDLPAVPPPARVPAAASTSAPNAHLYNCPLGHDLVVYCGGGWLVHRRVLVGMSKWMEENLPPEDPSGEVVRWFPDPSAWHPGRIHAIIHFMYFEDYPKGHYDPNKPWDMVCVLDNVAHYVCGGAVLCYPMMDMALNRIEAARAQMVKRLSAIPQSRLDDFEYHIRMALFHMYMEPNQPLLRDLRIAVGKLVADCAHIILQSPAWSTRYEELWGILRIRLVADHKWLYQAGLCEKNPVIMHGFEHMDILWVNHRDEGWQPAVDVMFPLNLLDTLPKPPPPDTPQSKKKTSRATRGRGRGAPTGLVEPAPQPVRGKGKQNKKTQALEKSTTGVIEEAGSSSTSKITPDTTSGATTEAGPSSTRARDGSSTADDPWEAYWANITAQYTMPTPILNLPPPSVVRARSSTLPTRPSSSSSALSAAADPFLPGESQPPADSFSTREPTSSFDRGESFVSTEYLESPARLAELYGDEDDEPVNDQDKDEDVQTAEGQSSENEETGQMSLDLSSVHISEKDDDDTPPSAISSRESHDEDDS